MRCAEAQELMTQGKSALYFNAPHYDWRNPLSDEVDRHLERCPECGEELIRQIRRRFRRRPGLIHWLRVRSAIRTARAKLATPQASGLAEAAPISRVAYTIITEGIKLDALRIDLAPVEVHQVNQVRKELPLPVADSSGGSFVDRMKRDVALSALMSESETESPRLIVRYLVNDVWTDRMVMPNYIIPPIFARYKSMADLLVSVMDQPQTGTITIRYENRDYCVAVKTTPEPLGERLSLEIAPG